MGELCPGERENRNLPSFVAIPDLRGLPPSGPRELDQRLLPAAMQGVAFIRRSRSPTCRPQRNCAGSGKPPGSSSIYSTISICAAIPATASCRGGIAAYELAVRMQLSTPEVADLSKESPATLRAYGADSQNTAKTGYARNCILAPGSWKRTCGLCNCIAARMPRSWTDCSTGMRTRRSRPITIATRRFWINRLLRFRRI